MLAYLQLVRLPAVFTAIADIILGYVLTHQYVLGPEGWHHPQKFFGLMLASCSLYMAGMVFNDIFDRKQDAAERPQRPIPSGRVPLRSAVILGMTLMALGLLAASTVSLISLQVAALLIIAIFAYDGLLKRTPAGPLAMGSCRTLNVLLGASDQSSWQSPGLLSQVQLFAAIGLGVYIVGVTVFARTEAKTSSRIQLGFAQLLFNTGIGILAVLICRDHWPPEGVARMGLGMLAVIAFTLNSRGMAALADPSPAKVQTAVKLLLLSYVMLDATVVFWKLSESGPYGAAHALVTASLILPAMTLARFIPMT